MRKLFAKTSTIVLASLIVLLASPFYRTIHAAELIMLEQDHCPYCQKFNREIGPIYPKTDEGKRAPLRRLMLDETWPIDLSNITSDTLTPTFILVDNNREIGRLRGYRGDEFFWALLSELFAKLDNTNASIEIKSETENVTTD